MSTTSSKIKLEAEISATSKGLQDALKQASSAVSETSSNWKDKFASLKDTTSLIGQSVKNLSDLIGKVGNVNMDVEGMDKIRSSISEVTGAFGQVKGEVDAFVAKLVEMKNAASVLGMPVDEYQRFSDAVKASGMSMDESAKMIQAMRQNIADFANGVPQAEQMFKELGITLEQVSSNTVAANFDLLVHALQSTVPPTEQARASMEMFRASVERTINVTQQYDKLLVEQTGHAYASDKDVQNAISLSNAIGKLGEQIGKYANGTTDAGKANEFATHSFTALFNLIDAQRNELADLFATYSNYVDQLKTTVTSTVDAETAFNLFNEKVKNLSNSINEVIEEYGLLDDAMSTPDEEVITIPTADIKNLQEVLHFVTNARQKISEEMVAVHGIMNQRISAGAPIDTKEMDIAISHCEQLKQTISILFGTINQIKNSGFKIDLGTSFDELRELDVLVTQASADFKKLDSEATLQNIILQLDAAQAEVSRLNEEYDNASGREVKVKVDDHQIERATNEVMNLNLILDRVDERRINIDTSKLNEIRDKTSKITSEWERLNDQVVAYNNNINKANTQMQQGGGDTSQKLKQIAGQLFGMGSQVAVIVKGFRTLGSIIKAYVIDPLTKANEQLRKMQQWQTDDTVKVSERNYNRFEQMEEDLKRYYETLQKYKKSQTEVDRNDLMTQQRDLSRKYGIDINERNVHGVMKEYMDYARKGRKGALESEIEAIKKLNVTLDKEYDEKDSYLKGDMFKSVEEKNRNKDRLIEIRKEQVSNNNRIAELQEQLRLINKGEDKLGDMYREQRAKRHDENREAEEEAQKKAAKAKEEQAKALEGATKKIEEWSNSLTDNDRQKNLREILSKYDEAVKAGVEESKARAVAEKAIAEMLKKENEDEEKKNKELLDAMNQKIEQYKKAYADYAKSQLEIRNAQREYANTQRRLADENREEAMQKRRDRLQQRMRRYGFTPFEGFRLREGAVSRRRRRSNTLLDERISEKMAQAERGERVRWTAEERRRIKSYLDLQKRDKAIEAAQKQMNAAKKQEEAADALKSAATAIRNAVYGRSDARKELKNAKQELEVAGARRRTTSRNLTPREMLREARRRGLNARGVSGASAKRMKGYDQQLETLHRDLDELKRRFFTVR